MRYYHHLIEQGQLKAAEEWLKVYNYWDYLNTKPIETLETTDGVEAAKELVKTGVKDA